MEIKPHNNFPGVYWILNKQNKKLATMNIAPGQKVYDEKIILIEGNEFRIWDPFKSKFAAGILKDLKIPIKNRQKILYLGAASGTTISHISDFLEPGGFVYCIEFSPRSIRDLIMKVSYFRKNVLPIFADARFPDYYKILIETVDGIYCDIAQRDQARILADNAEIFLKSEGWILLCIKARSINSIKSPAEIYKSEIKTLEDRNFIIKKIIELKPYHKDHIIVYAEYKK